MGKMAKRFLAMGLTLSMTVGMLAGCGGKTTTTDPTKAPEETKAGDATKAPEEAATSKYPDYSKGFKEKVTIQIPVYDRAFEGWDVTNNFYTKYVQKEFGDKYNVEVKFVAIGRSTEVTDYMQSLASKKAPDIIFHYDMPQALAYYGEGAMQKLDLEEIKNYAPTYYANTGATIEKYGSVNGDNYFFFGERPDAYNFVTLIRQDWIDKVGKTMPTNLEEYNELLKAWKDAGLGTGGGALIQNAYTHSYPYRDWPIDEKERALYSDLSVADFTWEPTKKFLKNLNYQYNNGLIDKEFYLNTDDASSKADFVSGNVGTYGTFLASNSDVIASLIANDKDAKVAFLPPTAGVPKGNKPQSRAYWPFGMIMGINSTTSDESRAAVWMYLDWLSQPENLFFMQNGVEGQNYTKDASGLAVKVPDFKGESKLSQNNNKDYWCLVIESAQYADEELNKKANLANWAPVGYEYIIEDAYKSYKENLQYATPDALFSVVIESVAENKSTLNDLWKTSYVKCVMAPEADFDSVYEAACKEFLDAGYQEILDEKQTAIDKGQYAK